MSQPTFHPPAGRPGSAARAVSLVAGIVLGLVAVGILAAGGLALWGDSKKDDAGYLSTGSHRVAGDGRALVTDDLDIDLDGVGVVGSGDAGKLRLKVDSDADKPVFVGIAPTSYVSAYLRGVEHSAVTDVDYAPFHADYERQAGARRPEPPAGQDFWTASAHGSGTQTLDWKVDDGSWSVVVMNADGSTGVSAAVSAGAKIPFLAAIGWGALGVGLVLLAGAAALMVLGVRMPPASSARARAGVLAPQA